jgi:aryl-alcohol dehydrogenase-like predicted oxidoreductase
MTTHPANIHTHTPSGKLDLGGLGVGLMQWGTTCIDDKFVNSKGNLSEEEVREMWRSCREHDIVFFDTAEGMTAWNSIMHFFDSNANVRPYIIHVGYGGGTSETRIGGVRKWYEGTHLDGKQDEIIIATKFLPTLWRWTKGAFYKSLHGSLERLGVESIDLYFIHTPIHPLPFECFVQWACDAADDGLIKHIGISNCNADLTRRAHAVAKKNGKQIECNQIMLNLLVWQSQNHRNTVQTCRELGIQVAAYSPIGQGLLTDGLTESKYSTIRAVRMTGVQYLDLVPLREEIERLSKTHNCTMAQIAINWVRGHGAIPLIGCRSVKQLKDAEASLGWSLSIREIENLNELSLGLSMFDRPMYRRCLFVVFISLLQLAYYTEQRYTRLKKIWFSNNRIKSEHEE